MSARRRDWDWTDDQPESDWLPPPWNEPARQIEPSPAPPATAERRRPNRAAAPRQARPDVTSRRVLAIAVSQGITGALALVVSLSTFLAGEEGTIPFGLFLVLTVQLLGYALTRQEEPAALRQSWIVGCATGAVALPILAVQVVFARQPYTGTAFASALPIVAATLAAGLILVLVAVALALGSHEIPEEAGLIYMPLALLVPAVIGIRSEVTEMSTVRALGESAILAAGATALAWSLPRQSRLLIPPFALAAQFVVLWMMGQGPRFASSSGSIVPLSQGGLLALDVVLVVALPLAVLWLRGITEAAERQTHERRLPEPAALGWKPRAEPTKPVQS